MKKSINTLMLGLILANLILYKLNIISQIDFQQILFIYPCVWVILSTADFDHEKK